MTDTFDLDCVEQMFERLGYQFTNRELVRLSLTAAGAESSNHDGNRRLALVGQAIINLVVIYDGYGDLLSRGRYFTVYT